MLSGYEQRFRLCFECCAGVEDEVRSLGGAHATSYQLVHERSPVDLGQAGLPHGLGTGDVGCGPRAGRLGHQVEER